MILLFFMLIAALVIGMYLPKLSYALYKKTYATHMVFEQPKKEPEALIPIMLLIIVISRAQLTRFFTQESAYGMFAVIFTLEYIPHLLSCIVFWYAHRYNTSIHGRTIFDYNIVRRIAASMILPASFMFLIVPVFAPTSFFIGCALGVAITFAFRFMTSGKLSLF